MLMALVFRISIFLLIILVVTLKPFLVFWFLNLFVLYFETLPFKLAVVYVEVDCTSDNFYILQVLKN